MEENEKVNEQNEQQVNNDGELKKQAAETLKATKEQMKNINFKEEAEKGKGLIRKLATKPIETIKEIVEDNKNQFYKTALVIIILWAALILIRRIINFIIHDYYEFQVLATIKSVLAPVLGILVMAIIIHVLNKGNNQPLTKSITAVSIAKIPLVISAVLGYLTYISSNITYVTSPISSLLSVISTVLMFFVVKEMFKEEENEKALKVFIKVEVIYYIVAFAFSFLGISL